MSDISINIPSASNPGTVKKKQSSQERAVACKSNNDDVSTSTNQDAPYCEVATENVFFSTMKAFGDAVCNIISDLARNVLGIFNPVIELVNKLSGVDENGQSVKVTTKEFTGTVSDVIQKISANKNINDKLSKETRDKLKKLEFVIKDLNENRTDLVDKDISEDIRRWRQSRDTQALFRMVAVLSNPNVQNGTRRCIHFTDEELREALIQGLESLATTLEEIRRRSPSEQRDRVEDEAAQAVEPLVRMVERINQEGTDENITAQEKEDAFRESQEHVENIVNDPAAAEYVGQALENLLGWLSVIKEFLNSWDEDRQEEEKQYQEKQCEERCEEKEQIKKLLKSQSYYKKKAEEFYLMKMNAKSKMQQFIEIKDALIKRFKMYAVNDIEKQLGRYKSIYDYAEAENSLKRLFERCQKVEKENLQNSLPPSYVCEESEFYSELDLSC